MKVRGSGSGIEKLVKSPSGKSRKSRGSGSEFENLEKSRVENPGNPKIPGIGIYFPGIFYPRVRHFFRWMGNSDKKPTMIIYKQKFINAKLGLTICVKNSGNHFVCWIK